jgi:hypothetical protein
MVAMKKRQQKSVQRGDIVSMNYSIGCREHWYVEDVVGSEVQ